MSVNKDWFLAGQQFGALKYKWVESTPKWRMVQTDIDQIDKLIKTLESKLKRGHFQGNNVVAFKRKLTRIQFKITQALLSQTN